MIGVTQEDINGCTRACVATVFEMSYREAPGDLLYDPFDPKRQMDALRIFLGARGLTLWTFGLHGQDRPLVMFGSKEPDWHLFPPGYWLAVVKSPRTGLGHVVVMKGATIAWDPHPGRDAGHRGFQEAMIFMLKGPE